MDRTVAAVAEFVSRAKKQKAEKIYIYATAAVREAQNKDEFCERIHMKTGLDAEILSGETEAKIAYLGAAEKGTDCAVMDIGGGSTEGIVSSGEAKVNAVSLKIGAVRMQEQFPSPDGNINGTLRSVMEEELQRKMEGYEVLGLNPAQKLIGVSGTATTLASMDLQLPDYNPEKIQGHTLGINRVAFLVDKLCSLTKEERSQLTGVPQDRADIIAYGSVILYTFMKKFGYKNISISDRDSLEGFLIYKTDKA
jgi:exopolyphosphatase/guanosine-5'-triphosphate,3'-diphosphate pyrophosphatase